MIHSQGQIENGMGESAPHQVKFTEMLTQLPETVTA